MYKMFIVQEHILTGTKSHISILMVTGQSLIYSRHFTDSRPESWPELTI